MLNELLEKLHLKHEDLKPDELKTYTAWAHVLAKPDPTIDDLRALLPKELERANAELRKFENSDKKDAFYKAYTELCQKIITIISSTTQERDNLKQFLKNKYGIE
jgi:hypothetical protein